MKLVLLLCLIAVAVAAQIPTFDSNQNARILYQNYENKFGSYKFGFRQSDGIRHEQEGFLNNFGQENENLSVKGSYSWLGPDGVTYEIDYTAGEDGFKPDISQGPGGGIPPQILGSMAG
ncbi:cuticular protein RR-1 motif 29 precursor [Bombyx mori]|uniref:Putative cuticle protein n=1 Tax=Bombyx mori TaxID=7091 RepID=C0H6M0_BOMMO|nr:cuticular protein RR-1 motif 29 precursor [Bombyx mori]FAA00531.1 TPA: putative cuticle protein [Bombyx mori]